MGKKSYDLKKVKRAVGLKLREIRHEKGWTLEETEEHGWSNWRTLQAIEMGRNLKLETLLKLASLYGIHPSVLLKDI